MLTAIVLTPHHEAQLPCSTSSASTWHPPSKAQPLPLPCFTGVQDSDGGDQLATADHPQVLSRPPSVRKPQLPIIPPPVAPAPIAPAGVSVAIPAISAGASAAPPPAKLPPAALLKTGSGVVLPTPDLPLMAAAPVVPTSAGAGAGVAQGAADNAGEAAATAAEAAAAEATAAAEAAAAEAAGLRRSTRKKERTHATYSSGEEEEMGEATQSEDEYAPSGRAAAARGELV
jgi:hypothetical protein